MAGYLISLGSEEALLKCINSGIYSTFLNPPRFDAWMTNHEGTFADYLSMKEDDLIFFFINRKIYGCGRLVNIGKSCRYLNYQNADTPRGDSDENFTSKLLPDSTTKNRCFCTFEPYPYFFTKGVDMDEVLQSKSCPFHSVRTMWKLSFIKLDDDESVALFNIILKSNEENLSNREKQFAFNGITHQHLRAKNLSSYKLNSKGIVNACANLNKSVLGHEMAIEAYLCEQLSMGTDTPFGNWDYISHQVCASPFKPVDYMDKMDIFGYRYISGYKVKSKFLIMELKKDSATVDVVHQTLKYVDWVTDEYAYGDYDMIEAFIVASDFNDDVKNEVKQHAVRNFTKGFRPSEFRVWNNLKLVKYSVASDGNDLNFEVVPY